MARKELQLRLELESRLKTRLESRLQSKRSTIPIATCVVAMLLRAAPVGAQGWPLPARTPNTPVPCPSGSVCAGRSIAPYPPPLQFLAVWLDSTSVRDWQLKPRTLRARLLRIDPQHDRVYEIQGGSVIAAYKLSRLADRMAAGEPLQSMWRPQGAGERFLAWDGGGWDVLTQPQCDNDVPAPGCLVLHNTDGNDRVQDLDFDDRGYVYVSADPFGWIILRYDGLSFRNVWQDYPSTVSPNRVFSFRAGARYYVVAGYSASAALYDVTNVAAPVRVRDLPGVDEWAKVGTDRLAFISGGRLMVTTAAALAQGTPATIIKPSLGAMTSVTVSGAGFVATARYGGDPAQVWIEGAGWGTLTPGLRYQSGPWIRCSPYYCIVHGDEQDAWTMRLFRPIGGSLVPIPINTGTRPAFVLLYHNTNLAAASGYAAPGLAGEPADMAFVPHGGRTLMLTALSGLGVGWYLDGSAPGPAVPQPQPQPQPAPVTPPAPAPTTPPPCPPSCPAGSQCVPAPQPPTPTPAPQPPAPVPAPVTPPVVQPQPTGSPCDGRTALPRGCVCDRGRLLCR